MCSGNILVFYCTILCGWRDVFLIFIVRFFLMLLLLLLPFLSRSAFLSCRDSSDVNKIIMSLLKCKCLQGVNPTYSYTVIVLCILCYLFFVIPAFNNPKSYSPSCGSSTTSTTISFIMSRFFPEICTYQAGTSNSNRDLFLTPTILSEKSTVDFTSRQEEQQQRQDEEKELNFLTWVAFAYTAVLLMVAAEGIWDDHFRAAASYKKTPAVSIKIHHDTLFKVIGWAFAGGAIMFMAWGVGFVLLDE